MNTEQERTDAFAERDLGTMRQGRLRALDEVERLRKALKEIANLDVPRPIGTVYRRDGVASKSDQCHHDVWMYEECADCVADFARAALSEEDKA